MKAIKRKMKFLATKLSALQSELSVSREIFQAASRDVEEMFQNKYFPHNKKLREQQKINEKDADIKEYSEEEAEKQQFNQQQKENQSQQAEDNSDLPDQLSANKNADPEVKKMFRKIASQCHPDKLQDLEEGFEKARKEQLYQRARQALENNDILIMADIAGELEIEIPEITEVQLKEAENKIINIKKELQMIESTAVWQWFFTEDKEKKKYILNHIFEAMYGQRNTRS